MVQLRLILVTLVAVEALGIMLFEMFGSQTKAAQRAFGLSADFLAQPEARVAFANQGLYNGFLGVGLLVAEFALVGAASLLMQRVFLIFIIVAAVFGMITVSRQIIWTQGLPAILALLALL
ncbi:DUF1304 domain-containing protein [Levilactobacillus bambusae]|uniref:DUF1304 domain-containing protein n=1 Tax=Levilactobacillus bambusae TaxID=2024736 RepID=A0A2V1MZG3_9LACO|nr:DUF1304 domain-containing protein [Levilactobacillus bambusae]PWG00404.1 DUF1304 domain-containing protein [Levilactobacillus bambusae]